MLETLRQTIRSFSAHGGRVLGAATAFYAMLSVAPMLLLALVITGMVTDRDEARAQVVYDVSLWVGDDGGRVLSELLDALGRSQHGSVAGVLGFLLLLYAAQRLFAQLRYSLNHLWGVRESSAKGLKAQTLKQLRKRLAALLMVVVVVAVVASMVLGKAALGAAMSYFGVEIHSRWVALEMAVSLAVLTLLFGAMFRVLPAAKIDWRDAMIGAVATAFLFSLGAVAIGWYLGFKSASSSYGAAGSFVASLLWVNYSAQVFFLGASFTRIYAERHGRGLELGMGVVRLVESDAETSLLE